ncbi:hypothetical protein [Ornithinimicrobium avium]|uniref:Uncharacterized protein n=1 Tax=Ornithinimicrobium avium TaxID=2283195 RepID=A0A345NPD8_9MICO|nr:hypothetical protein [Ornithinimicrobium avium]AXH96896.1 hypothetical protein DV701_12910 [Ornithinimicrobium avium]
MLGGPALRDFFARVGPARSKREVVLTYELGLTRTIDEGGLTRDVGWTHEELGLPPEADLPLEGWKGLLEAGLPFVKRTLQTHPRFAVVRVEVGARIRAGLGQPASSSPSRYSP